MIDSQTVRSADTIAAGTVGYDAGKKIKGRKRHIATDTNGLLLAVVVTAASIQDRDAAHRLLAAMAVPFATITYVFADGGYTGRMVTWAKTVLTKTVQIEKRSDTATGFEVRPRRWVVERTFGKRNAGRGRRGDTASRMANLMGEPVVTLLISPRYCEVIAGRKSVVYTWQRGRVVRSRHVETSRY